MKNICIYFDIHQPWRLKRYRFFDIGFNHYYYDDFQSEDRLRDVIARSYMPANAAMMEIIRSAGQKFRCAYAISGVALELFEQFAPEVIDSFKELAATDCVEFLAEPYAHSLASVYDKEEFEAQIERHAQKIESLFGKRPTAFRNAELIYSDEIGEMAAHLGFKTMLMEQTKNVMGWKSPNYVYNHAYIKGLKLLIRNFELSNDLAFRFSDRSWQNFPLQTETFINWIANTPAKEEVFNVWMGYEALGILNNADSGIFNFLKALPRYAANHNINFCTPSEISGSLASAGDLSVTFPTSWSGMGKDLAPFTGNDLQQEALSKLYAVSERVRLCRDHSLQHDWLMLQTSDYFRYMSHYDAYESNFESPYDAFTNYMNILADFLERVDAQYPTGIENEELNGLLKTINNQDKEIEQLTQEVNRLKIRKKE